MDSRRACRKSWTWQLGPSGGLSSFVLQGLKGFERRSRAFRLSSFFRIEGLDWGPGGKANIVHLMSVLCFQLGAAMYVSSAYQAYDKRKPVYEQRMFPNKELQLCHFCEEGNRGAMQAGTCCLDHARGTFRPRIIRFKKPTVEVMKLECRSGPGESIFIPSKAER